MTQAGVAGRYDAADLGGADGRAASLARVFADNTTRERILAAAIAVVAGRGFGAFTVKEIAQAAGIKAPGLYSHFSSKEAILTEAVSRVLADFTSNVTAGVAGDPEAALRDTVRRHVLYQVENMPIARVADLFLTTATAGDFVSEEDYQRLLADQRGYLDLVSARVSAFAPEVPRREVKVVSIAIIAMCDRVANWYRADGGMSAEELADLHWRLARSMVLGGVTTADQG